MARIIEKGIRTRVRKEDRTSFYWQIFAGVASIVALIFVIALVWYVTRLEAFTITEISIRGGETISHEEIKGEVEQELIGTYFRVIPKRFAYLYPKDRIIDVVSKNERVHDVLLERISRNHIEVSFDEYVPHALVCPVEDTSCFFMTKEGYAFAQAPELQGGVFVRHYVEAYQEISEGVALGEDILARIDSFSRRIEEEFGFRTASLLHKKNGDMEISLHGGGTVFVTVENDLDLVLENMRAILASEEFAHIQPGNFNYIDLRFGNKAFVNEEMGVATGTESVSTSTLPE